MYATFIGFGILMVILLLGCLCNFLRYGKDVDLWEGIFSDGLIMLVFIMFVVLLAYILGKICLYIMLLIL